jgi:hypothetical protein
MKTPIKPSLNFATVVFFILWGTFPVSLAAIGLLAVNAKKEAHYVNYVLSESRR